jgi:hypothetical protein
MCLCIYLFAVPPSLRTFHDCFHVTSHLAVDCDIGATVDIGRLRDLDHEWIIMLSLLISSARLLTTINTAIASIILVVCASVVIAAVVVAGASSRP